MLRVIEAILPSVANIQSNNKVKQKIKNEQNLDFPSKNVDLAAVTINDLQQIYDFDKSIKDKLEDKAKTNIIGVTISVTLIMGAYSLIQNVISKHGYSFLFWIAFCLFILSVIYMLAAGISSIHVLTAENVFHIPEIGLTDDEKKKDYDKQIGFNRARNTIRNNYVFTSYECIRNSLVCLFAVMVIAIVPAYTKNVNQSKQQGFFFFSESAMESIANGINRQDIEDTINQDRTNGEHTVINEDSRLFIKYSVDEDQVIVLLAEQYQ